MKNDIKNEKKRKFLPVVFVKGMYNYHRQNTFQQNLLLKALQVTSDPKLLRSMIGVKSVADVYRTLDKIAIRKEYHEALARAGLDLDTIVEGIKSICQGNGSDAIRLKGYQALMKSIGLDEYKETAEQIKGSWEDVLVKHIEKEKSYALSAPQTKEYEVIVPETPKEEQERIVKEREAAKGLYE